VLEALVISNVLLWLVVIVLAVIVVALTRQIGVLYERVAPAGALVMPTGLTVGEAAPQVEARDLGGAMRRVGGARDDGRSTLIFFLSPTCPVCKTLLPALRSARGRERASLEVVLASDGDEVRQRAFVRDQRLEDFPYLLSTELGRTYGVGKLPHAVLIDADGVLRAQGLVNSREHLESLFIARETGVASLQEYLARDGGRSERESAA
jgi:methylamine dehydrogenase accessory protein MauD